MLWNEPNNLSHWNFHLDPGWEKFAAMVRVSAKAIREVNPELPIVLGGVSSCDARWLALMRGHGALENVDIAAVHGFPLDWNHWQIPNAGFAFTSPGNSSAVIFGVPSCRSSPI